MIDFLLGTLAFFLRAIGFVLDVARAIGDMLDLARRVTGSDKLVDVPRDPRPVTPAAQRSLSEAEERERLRASAGRQAASGSVQAS